MQPIYSREFCEPQYIVRASIPDHPQIFMRWAETSANVRKNFTCDLDIKYGEGPGETLDVFPAIGEAKAMLIFVHGGYWRSLDKSDFSYLVPELAKRGIVVALTNYALAPDASIGTMVQQTRNAIAWLYRHLPHFGIDPEALYVAGHSAGAHLATMMLATDWRKYGDDIPADLFKGALAISGLYDLEPLRYASVNDDLKLDADSVKKLSPALLKIKSDALIYLAAGELESDEFKRQTDLLAQHWRDNEEEHLIVAQANHLNIMDHLADADSELFKMCLRMMRIK